MEREEGITRMLQKLSIEKLNDMQVAASEMILENEEVILLSPTGTGKTLAFLLPLIQQLDPTIQKIQSVVLVPSRELAIQIEQVARDLGSGFKINAFYGGRSFSKDIADLVNPPAILIGTPGRILDHIRRATISLTNTKILVLDEFDKSLEIGFEEDMLQIIGSLPKEVKKVLTSATQKVQIPEFVGLKDPMKLDFLIDSESGCKTYLVESVGSNREAKLANLLNYLNGKNGIVFCNFRDSVNILSDYLYDKEIGHGCFYGGLEQKHRERALIKFRNGSDTVLIATDLAARGIDIPEMDFIIHYELPPKADEYIHRNGRTARMHSKGAAYIIKSFKRKLPTFIEINEELKIGKNEERDNSKWATLFISGGRRDKISKGDIAGLFFKQGQLSSSELGIIELKTDCAFVAVASNKAQLLVSALNNVKLKKKKVRLKLI